MRLLRSLLIFTVCLFTALAATLASPAGAAGDPVVSVVMGDGTPGSGEGQLNNPYGVAFGPDGAMYVSDSENSRVVRLSAGGRSSVVDTGEIELRFPSGIAFDGEGTLYIADSEPNVEDARVELSVIPMGRCSSATRLPIA